MDQQYLFVNPIYLIIIKLNVSNIRCIYLTKQNLNSDSTHLSAQKSFGATCVFKKYSLLIKSITCYIYMDKSRGKNGDGNPLQ